MFVGIQGGGGGSSEPLEPPPPWLRVCTLLFLLSKHLLSFLLRQNEFKILWKFKFYIKYEVFGLAKKINNNKQIKKKQGRGIFLKNPAKHNWRIYLTYNDIYSSHANKSRSFGCPPPPSPQRDAAKPLCTIAEAKCFACHDSQVFVNLLFKTSLITIHPVPGLFKVFSSSQSFKTEFRRWL